MPDGEIALHGPTLFSGYYDDAEATGKVFTEDGCWYVCVHTVCKHLQPDDRCGIYETRPPICREYTTKDCEYEDDWVYDQYFETPEQVVEYMEAVLGPGGERIGDGRRRKTRGRSIRSPKPPLLPIV